MREGDFIAMCVNAGCLPFIAAFSLVSIHFVHSRASSLGLLVPKVLSEKCVLILYLI
jgi:hypothetical protein